MKKVIELESLDAIQAFSATYRTNLLGRHRIAFSSGPMTNGEVAIPYTLTFSYGGEAFMQLAVGTDRDLYTTSGLFTVNKTKIAYTLLNGDIRSASKSSDFSVTLDVVLKFGDASDTLDDIPAGDYTANLRYEVTVE